MPLKSYGVLKGRAIGRLRDADDDHYQILVSDGGTQHRIAVNVKSKATNAPSELLFQSVKALPKELTDALAALKPGFKKVPSKKGGMALDYVRGGVVDPKKMKPVPPDAPGADNDLKDLMEKTVRKAMDEDGAVVYAFGEKWGPEKNKKDKYFHFKPGNGIHDIHMNQGNSGPFVKDDGVYQDGALVFQFASGWLGLFLAFQSQTFETDDKTGHAKTSEVAAAGPVKAVKAVKKKKKKGKGAGA